MPDMDVAEGVGGRPPGQGGSAEAGRARIRMGIDFSPKAVIIRVQPDIPSHMAVVPVRPVTRSSLMKGKIVVVPLGESDFLELNKLAGHLAQVFTCAVDMMSGARLPDEAYSPIRGQYFAMVLLQKLELLKSNEREKVIALIDEDLYTPNRAWVIGASDRIAGTAIVSLYRLRNEYFGYEEEDKVLYRRTVKETVHQLGHLFGMRSCRNPRCAMYASERMQDIDGKVEKFCDNCLRRIGRKV